MSIDINLMFSEHYDINSRAHAPLHNCTRQTESMAANNTCLQHEDYVNDEEIALTASFSKSRNLEDMTQFPSNFSVIQIY